MRWIASEHGNAPQIRDRHVPCMQTDKQTKDSIRYKVTNTIVSPAHSYKKVRPSLFRIFYH